MKMRVGIAGCGFVANYHVNAWRSAGAEVMAVSDIAEDRAREFARMHNAPRYFTSVGIKNGKFVLRNDVKGLKRLTYGFVVSVKWDGFTGLARLIAERLRRSFITC
jgi:threonine dehydrogenase-like Zn-dependent dehydrogenase